MSVNETSIKALEGVLKPIIGDDPTDALAAFLKQEKPLPLSEALQSITKKPAPDAALLDKLRQLIAISNLANSHIPLVTQLLQDGLRNIKDIARDSYGIPVTQAEDPSVLESYQSRLFAAEPTSVLLGLIIRDSIKIPDDESQDVQALVEKVFSEALKNDFRIEKISVKTLFAKSEALKAAKSEHRDKAVTFLKSLQRLQALVQDPKAIKHLMETDFPSASSIAQCHVDDFVQVMVDEGLDPTEARRIHDQATTVELRNEQTWAHGLQKRNEWAMPRVISLQSEQPKPPSPQNAEDKAINLTNLFKDMDTVACEECSSVLSPAAYFVDLLRLLQESPATKDKGSDTLFKLLMDRRPDLQNIELSCANTNTTISYLDLVNEVLEAHILFLNGNATANTVAHNVPADSSNDHNRPQPAHVNISVYRDVLQRQGYPMKTFPYNYSIDAVRSLLSACQTSRLDVLKVFQAPERVLQTYKHITKAGPNFCRLYYLVADLISACLSAETLGLQPDDIMAITGVPCQSFELWRACHISTAVDLEAEYRKSLRIPTTAELWGYSSTANMLEETNGTGLTFIRRELLRRSGISLQNLHDILKTQFMGRRLAITSTDENNLFSKKLDNMRLRMSLLGDVESGTLTEQVCLDLQAFIRLFKKTGWSIAELDSILSTLRRNSEDSSSTRSISPQWSITPEIIKELAAVRQLSDTFNFPPAFLQPLWGNIDTNGPNSLYHQLFLRPGITAPDSIFKPANGTELVLTGSQPISLHKSTIVVALSINEQDLTLMLPMAGLTLSSPVTLENMSKLYRISLLCGIFEIKRAEYPALLNLLVTEDLFSSPTSSLSALTKLQSLFDDGWELENLSRVINGSLSDSESEAALKATARLTSGTLAIEASYPAVLDGLAIAPLDSVSKALALLFEQNVAAAINSLIEGTQKTVVTVDLAKITTFQIPKQLFSKLSGVYILEPDANPQVRLTLTGILTGAEKELVDSMCKDLEGWKEAVDQLWDLSRQHLKTLSQRILKENEPSEVMVELFARSSDTSANERRLWLLGNTSPILKTQLMQQLVVESVAADFAINNGLLMMLLKDAVRVRGDKNAFAAMKSASVTNLSTTTFDGMFLPPLNEEYEFSVPGDVKPEVTIHEIPLEFTSKSSKWVSQPIRLSSGKAYSFKSTNFSLIRAEYQTKDALLPLRFTADMFLNGDLHNLVLDVYKQLGTAFKIVNTFDLDRQEAEIFCRGKAGPRIDFSKIQLQDLLRIHNYTYVRSRTAAKAKTKRPAFSEFIEWLHKKDSKPEDLAGRLSKGTGWALSDVSTILSSKFPLSDDKRILDLLKDEQQLVQIADIFQLVSGLNNERLDKVLLFRVATPVVTAPATSEKDPSFAIANELEICVQPSLTHGSSPNTRLQDAYDNLRNRRREAMIQYLLNHENFRDFIDADNLFEHFLIDVQMGPQLQTSRIKQAISTIQLFVQRCNLGKEIIGPKDKKQTCLGVKPVRWKYMSKYTLWEANRNLFLYPENWIDPIIRDNKTELFKAFESSMMQNNLDMQTISDAISTYVHGLNDIATLDVRAYFHERLDVNHSKFHFFARTRQAPFEYYYRTMSSKVDTMLWLPWTKIEVDIPSLETDERGNSIKIPGCYLAPVVIGGRLFLFLPQFMLQTEQSAGSDQPFDPKEDSKVTPPTKYWEIKMGWTELRNGRWAPKRVSQSILKVPGAGEAKTPPALSSFQFYINTVSSDTRKHSETGEDDVVIVDVSCWGSNEGGKWTFESEVIDASNWRNRFIAGRFKIRGSQVTVAHVPAPGSTPALPPTTGGDPEKAIQDEKNQDDIDLAAPTVAHISFPSHFSKIWSLSTNGGVPDARPNIAIGLEPRMVDLSDPGVPNSLLNREFTWTMSFQDLQLRDPSALVVDVASQLTRSTYFVLPYKPSEAGKNESKNSYKPCQFDGPIANELMQRSISGDVVSNIYQYLSTKVSSNSSIDAFGKIGSRFNEHAKPYSLYVWELGMHTISLLMERLLSTQQFELALSMARLVFDPTIEGAKISRCWRFFPFETISKTGFQSIIEQIDSLEELKDRALPTKFEDAISNWKDNPFAPHSSARDSPVVYMKRFVMKYIEILIASGDSYFRQNSLESIPLAIQRYVEASHLFGPPPVEVPKLGKMSVKTFAGVVEYMDSFSNAKVDMELDFPYRSEPTYRGFKSDGRGAGDADIPLTSMIRAGYFCVPANPQLVKLRNLIQDRFYKIRNSLDINGQPLALPLFDTPLDPAVLAQAQVAGLPPSAVLNDLEAPMPNHRFHVLLQKAFEVCAELKSLGDQFLAVKEKRDAEGLTMLISRQDVLTNTSLIPIKEMNKLEIERTIESLEEVRKSHVNRLQYYLALIGESPDKVPDTNVEWTDIVQNIEKPTSDDLRMSSFEKLEMDKADNAAKFNDVASALELTAAGLSALPNLMTQTQPMGVGASFKFDADNIAASLKGTAKVMQLKAQMDSHDSQRASRKGQMTRQLQDRRLQANSAGRDIKHTDRDISVQRIRLAISNREIEVQKLSLDRAVQIQEWHRSKYANETLYAWLENSFRRTFYETYLLVMQLARRAERAYQFETAPRNGTTPLPTYLAPSGYWDTARDGLLSATSLYLGLKKLEMASMERRPHDYELVKNFSLRQLDPLALLRLRQAGSTQFSLNEMIFDMDFPGHYFRRIKTVSASVYCIVGRYTGINCSLSLVNSRVRASAMHSSYPYQGRDDTRFRTDRIPITSIAMSNGQNDAGVFELTLVGDRYLPFEGAGAISTWKLEFPSQLRQFDWTTISDVVFNLRYTALEGGAALRSSANKCVKESLKQIQSTADDHEESGGSCSLLELRNDFANEWRQALVSKSGKIHLGSLADRLPFWTNGQTDTKIVSVSVIVPKEKSAGVTLSASVDIALEEMQGDDFGEGFSVLMNKNSVKEPVDSSWEVALDPSSFDDAFYRSGNVYLVVKFTTNLKSLA